MRWLPSLAIRMTPPRASADHRTPSGSARMHSGRCRSWPTYCNVDLSMPKSSIGFIGAAVLLRMSLPPAFRSQNVGQIALRFGEAGFQSERGLDFVLGAIDRAGR